MDIIILAAVAVIAVILVGKDADRARQEAARLRAEAASYRAASAEAWSFAEYIGEGLNAQRGRANWLAQEAGKLSAERYTLTQELADARQQAAFWRQVAVVASQEGSI